VKAWFVAVLQRDVGGSGKKARKAIKGLVGEAPLRRKPPVPARPVRGLRKGPFQKKKRTSAGSSGRLNEKSADPKGTPAEKEGGGRRAGKGGGKGGEKKKAQKHLH